MSARRANAPGTSRGVASNQSALTSQIVSTAERTVNYRQFLLCVAHRGPQVRAWIGPWRVAKASLVPFIAGYEFRMGLGAWFPPVNVWDGQVIAWCGQSVTHVNSKLERTDLSAAAFGIADLARRGWGK